MVRIALLAACCFFCPAVMGVPAPALTRPCPNEEMIIGVWKMVVGFSGEVQKEDFGYEFMSDSVVLIRENEQVILTCAYAFDEEKKTITIFEGDPPAGFKDTQGKGIYPGPYRMAFPNAGKMFLSDASNSAFKAELRRK